MKFVVEHISKNSGRLGCLVHNESGKRYKTPLLLQVTKVTFIKQHYYMNNMLICNLNLGGKHSIFIA